MSSNKSWDLKINRAVFKALRRFPRGDREAIVTVLDSLPQNPFVGDIEKMKGEDYSWRRRIGSYRIFYDLYIETKTIHVTAVTRRTSNTY